MRTLSRIISISVVLVASLTPSISLAQTSDQLHATIVAELQSDPRASSLSPDEMNALVDALADQASKQGLTANDVMWQPESGQQFPASEYATAPECDTRSLWCRANMAFGFSGSDSMIAIWLGITSALLILIIGAMIEVHHLKHKKEVANVPSAVSTP